MVLQNSSATWKQCNWETQKAQLFLSCRLHYTHWRLTSYPYYPKYFKFVMFVPSSGHRIHQSNTTCSLEKENLKTDFFLQNNCIITKAVEIMSENKWCDRLRNIKAVPEHVQQRFESSCVPQLQETFLLISPCQGFDRQRWKKKNVQMYHILLS